MAEIIGLAIIAAVDAAAITAPAVFATGTAVITIAPAAAPLIGTAVIVGVSLGVSYLMRPKPPKPDDAMQTKRLGVSPRVGGYGRCRIGGSYVLYETSSDDRSVDILALLSGKISSFQQWYLNEDAVTLVADGASWVVAGGADGRYSGNNIRIDLRDGSASQTAYPTSVSLMPSIWTSAHKGNGIASVEVAAQTVDANQFQKIYPHGPPEPSVVADLYALWDFRDAAQSPTNPATWVAYPAWAVGTTYAAGARVLYEGAVYVSAAAGNTGFNPESRADKWACAWQNPVLQLVDFLTHQDHGMGLDRARVIDPVIAALTVEANLCDAQVAKKGGTEPRYRACGTFDFSTAPDSVIGTILASCDGWLAENGDGTIALKVGVYRAPTVMIGMPHILGFGIQYGVGAEEVVNVMPITFSYPANLYREVPGEPWRDEASISMLGLERPRDLSFPWVQSFSQARRLAKRAMAHAQVPLKGSVVTDLFGLVAMGERYIWLDYPVISGLEMAVVEVQNIKVDFQNGRVSIDWAKVDPTTIDAWDPATEEGDAPPIPADLVPMSVPDITNLEFVSEGGGVYVLEFDNLHRADVAYEMRYRRIDGGGGTYGAWVTQSIPAMSVTDVGERSSFTIPGSLDMALGYEFQVAAMAGKTLGEWSSGAYSFEAEAVALRDRMVPPPPQARLELINTLIKALKTGGVWALLDGFYVLAAHASAPALLNWRQNAFNLSVVGAPVFTTDRGYSAFTGTAYLNTGFDPVAAAGEVWSLNSAHLAVYVRDNTVAAGADMGQAAGTSWNTIYARFTGDVLQGSLQGSANAALATGVTDSRGLFVVSRTSSSGLAVYRNNALLASPAQASSTLMGTRTLLLGAVNLGTPTASGRALGMGSFGAGLTAPQELALYNAVQAYMTAVGANV